MSAPAIDGREAYRTMTGPQYQEYLSSLVEECSNEPRFKVESAVELAATPQESETILARARMLKRFGDKGAREFDALTVIETSEFADSDGEEPNWQVRGLIPPTGTGLHIGASGTLKSFAEIDLAATINRGVPFHGLEVTKGRAVIIVAEGIRGFKRRLRAYAKHHGVPLMDLPAIVPAPVNLFESVSVIALIEQIKLSGGATYCVFDTKWRCSGTASENDATDQAKIFSNIDLISRELNCFCMAVAHIGKNGDGIRGSSAQYAAADVELTQERTGDTCTLRVSKAKDSDGDAQYAFKIITIDLGRNAHGEPESSLVLEPIAPAVAASEFHPKTKAETAIYDYVRKSGKTAFSLEALVSDLKDLCKMRKDNIRRAVLSLVGRLFTADGDTLRLCPALIVDPKGWLE